MVSQILLVKYTLAPLSSYGGNFDVVDSLFVVAPIVCVGLCQLLVLYNVILSLVIFLI